MTADEAMMRGTAEALAYHRRMEQWPEIRAARERGCYGSLDVSDYVAGLTTDEVHRAAADIAADELSGEDRGYLAGISADAARRRETHERTGIPMHRLA
jgi:hypothetical protein